MSPTDLTASPIKREFLGWKQTALPQAVYRLGAGYREGSKLDLGRVLVVVPGQRAGRRLLELLAFFAEDEKLQLTPPRIITEGSLPEMLYTPRLPFANDLVQDLAWAQALRDLPGEKRRHVVPQPPANGDVLRWLGLGKMMRDLHVELARDGLDFAAVRTKGAALAGFSEEKRWEALLALQQGYLRRLDDQKLWDIQTARLKAIEFGEVCTDCDIILLGTVDLNNTLRQMLDQVSGRVTAYIVAPENLAERFDAHGCLIPDRWSDALIPLCDEQLCQVPGPDEQAESVADWLVELDGRYRTDEVAIGVADESLVPQLQRQLKQCGVDVRWVEGTRIAETAPYRLLAAALPFAGQQRYDDLAALVRHPDLEDWLESALAEPATGSSAAGTARKESLPAQLDRFYNAHLPSHVRAASVAQNEVHCISNTGGYDDANFRRRGKEGQEGLRGGDKGKAGQREEEKPDRGCYGRRGRNDNYRHVHAAEGEEDREGITLFPDLVPALERIEAWLADASVNRPLRAWGEIFRKVLGAVYGGGLVQVDKLAESGAVLHGALARMLDECNRLESIPQELDTPLLSAADAFHVALGPLATEALPPAANPNAVEILGWLELPLDDSPALVVTSFNEGFVPKSTGTDAFLPDRLRQELKLMNNEGRYARDAYATSVLCHSREKVRFVFARRDTNKDPLQPSRLIFACPDDPLVRRARKFFGEKEEARPRRLLLAPAGPIPNKSAFKVPPPEKSGTKLERISVTRFKTYLACPYRYYLRHVCRLEAVNDAGRELDGGPFGTLLHRVLGAFGRDLDGPRHSDRVRDIFDFLAERLSALAEDLYGTSQLRPAIRLQLEQARRRLSAFASRQAEHVRQGWRIVYAEDDDEESLSVPFAVDGESINLVGRIDRIDFHEALRTIRIIDYKSAEKAQTPDGSHRKDDKWIDLQLPLYRHLWRATRLNVPADCAIELGYFNLPKQADDIKFAPASWDGAMLASADLAAADVIRNLRAEKFDDVRRPAPEHFEDLSGICLDNLYFQPALSDNEDGDAACAISLS